MKDDNLIRDVLEKVHRDIDKFNHLKTDFSEEDISHAIGIHKTDSSELQIKKTNTQEKIKKTESYIQRINDFMATMQGKIKKNDLNEDDLKAMEYILEEIEAETSNKIQIPDNLTHQEIAAFLERVEDQLSKWGQNKESSKRVEKVMLLLNLS